MNRQRILKNAGCLIVVLLLLVGCSWNEYQPVEEIIIAREKMLLDE